MMGHRGCRLAVTYPEIAVMQTKAVIKAAIAVQKRHPDWNGRARNHDSARRRSQRTEILQEDRCRDRGRSHQRQRRRSEIRSRHDDRNSPRGADGGRDRERGGILLLRHERSDADDVRLQPRRRRQVPAHVLCEPRFTNPIRLRALIPRASANLMKMAVTLGQQTRTDHLHCGICGEHGGDPSSIEFCHDNRS